ncbi:MAG: hypothetical protein KY397_05705 [Gemmatimonadetes bacterium]|nr:hypothetical protein [Gemmatimonadota bacterium]
MRRIWMLMLALSTAALFTVAACEQEPGAETGEATEEVEAEPGAEMEGDADVTAEDEDDLGEDIEAGIEEVGETLEEGAEKVGEGTEAAGEAIQEGTSDEDEEPNR